MATSKTMADPVGEKQNKASVYRPAKSGQMFCCSRIYTYTQFVKVSSVPPKD